MVIPTQLTGVFLIVRLFICVCGTLGLSTVRWSKPPVLELQERLKYKVHYRRSWHIFWVENRIVCLYSYTIKSGRLLTLTQSSKRPFCMRLRPSVAHWRCRPQGRCKLLRAHKLLLCLIKCTRRRLECRIVIRNRDLYESCSLQLPG